MSCDPKGNHKSCLIYLLPQDAAVNANQTHDTLGNARKASRAAGSLRSLCTRVTWDPLNLTLDKLVTKTCTWTKRGTQTLPNTSGLQLMHLFCKPGSPVTCCPSFSEPQRGSDAQPGFVCSATTLHHQPDCLLLLPQLSLTATHLSLPYLLLHFRTGVADLTTIASAVLLSMQVPKKPNPPYKCFSSPALTEQ